jgi:hypothetical protein
MKMKRLERLRTGGTRAKMQLAIPLPRTPDGRAYRYSPNEAAHPRHFLIGDRVEDFMIDDAKRPRMKNTPGSPQTVCPYSGTVAADAEFIHPEDRKAALKIVKQAAIQDMRDAFSDMLKNATRGNKYLTYKEAPRRNHPRPRFGRRDLMRALVCDCCGRDYAVYAIALFCPDCGAPNLALHFAREVKLVTRQVELAERLGKEDQELAYRLLGNAHEDVLTAFEATLKTAYHHGVLLDPDEVSARPVGNDFQNLERGRRRFAEFSFDPFAELTTKERDALELNIQKRHVIGHNLGVVDSKFAQNASEATLGETVKLVAEDIREFAALCESVVKCVDDWLADESGVAPAAPEETHEAEQPMTDETIGDLGPLATAIGKWLAKASPDGLPDPVDEEAFDAAFADKSKEELGEAIAELEADGYLSVTHVSSPRGLPRMRITEDLFLTFDTEVFDTDPAADAIALAELVLAGDGSVSLAELHAESGMPLRRFNPAVSMVIAQVDERRVSSEGSSEYPSRSFALLDADRVAIKRLVKQLQG